jgi:hypothetical protein
MQRLDYECRKYPCFIRVSSVASFCFLGRPIDLSGFWISVAGMAACLFLAGCGKPDEGNRVPVAGKVTFTDGKPLPRGTVIFTPDSARGNPSQHEPRGPIDAEGNYKLSTTSTLAGVSPGWYAVTIVSQEPYDESKSSWDPPWLINRKFGSRHTSGLAAEVIGKAEPGRYDFQVSK